MESKPETSPHSSSLEEFGRYLTRERELRGIALKQVAEVTRISEEYLRALEEGHPDRLPGQVFIVGYVRAYAKCIGLSPDEAVLRYQESSGTVADAGGARTSDQGRRQRVALVVVAMLVIAVGLIWFLRART